MKTIDKFKYKDKTFMDRLQLFIYFCKTNNNKFQPSMFYHSNVYYCRAALEYKFNREFSLEEVKKLITIIPLKHNINEKEC